MMKKITPEGLRKLNLITALLHAAQGAAILILAKPYYTSVTANYLNANDTSKQLEQASHHLFDVNLAWVIAGFLFLSALMRALSATRKRGMYEADLKKGVNRARWAEYAIAGTAMLLTVAAIVGVADLGTLLLLAGLNVAMSLAAYATEVRVQANKRFSRLHFWLTELIGKTIWVGLLVYVVAGKLFASSPVPWYVYSIYGSMVVLFIAYVLNFYRQTKKRGAWGDYLFAERNYILLALIAQAALAWQIFAGALR